MEKQENATETSSPRSLFFQGGDQSLNSKHAWFLSCNACLLPSEIPAQPLAKESVFILSLLFMAHILCQSRHAESFLFVFKHRASI
jgi:hypothetical protein